MITNLELEEELVERLEKIAKARGISFRELVRGVLEQTANSAVSNRVVCRFEQVVHDFGGHIESPWNTLVELEIDEYAQNFSRK